MTDSRPSQTLTAACWTLSQYRRLKRMCGGHGQKYWIRRYLQRNPAESKDPCFPNHWVDREDFKVRREEPVPCVSAETSGQT